LKYSEAWGTEYGSKRDWRIAVIAVIARDQKAEPGPD
jgi:hypothetical protein